jgi:glucose/arabinose dehydrogenase
VPITVRFSDFAGVPTVSDADSLASPRDMAMKFPLPGQIDTDRVAESYDGFPTRTAEELLEFGRAGAQPEIWSYGHRNVQSAALHPETGQLWIVEHGARGGNELNRVEAGQNYGWPVIGYGVHYSWRKIGEGTAKPGMEQPIYYWDLVP